MEIVGDDLSGPEIASFLEAHLAEMRAVTPAESVHALPLDDLRAADVTFWTVLEGGEIVACGAIKLLGGGHGELKSMRVAPSHRNRGVGSTLLRHLLDEAARLRLTRLFLETGSFAFFEPARRLYLKHGFEFCGPFGDYELDPNSSFMTKAL